MTDLKQNAYDCDYVLEEYKHDMDMEHIMLYNSKLEIFVKNYLRLIKKAYERKYVLIYYSAELSSIMFDIYAFINEHSENFEDALILHYEIVRYLIVNLSFIFDTPITLDSKPGNFIKFYRHFGTIYNNITIY